MSIHCEYRDQGASIGLVIAEVVAIPRRASHTLSACSPDRGKLSTGLPTYGVQPDTSILNLRLHASSGRHISYVTDYRPSAGMSQVFSALALVDLRDLDRMTAVARPDRRPAAILFADLEASSPLSKRVSIPQYFAVCEIYYRTTG